MSSSVGKVVRFEVVRNLKKPSFWIAALLFPILLVGYLFVAGLMGMSMDDAITGGSDTTDLKLGVLDESGLIVDVGEMEIVESEEAGVAAVRSGELDVFYYIANDFVENPRVRLFERVGNSTLIANFEGPIRAALAQSAVERVDIADILILTGSFSFDTVRFDAEGEEDNVFGRLAAPMLALAIFYILMVMFGNRLTLALVEEKESRISEMLLTTVSSKSLIMGKIISMILIGFVQMLVLIIPMVIAYFVMRDTTMVADLSLPPLQLEPFSIISSLVLLLTGYFLFVALCLAVGALVPTARDAGTYASVMMIMVIMPLFFIASFMSDKPDAIVYILSYFPFSAPVTMLFRNAMGTLPAWEFALGLVVILVSSVITYYLVVRIFRYSAMEYSAKLSPLELFKKKNS